MSEKSNFDLSAVLRLASSKIRRADCPGNINVDIPAMVLTDLAALAVEQWDGDVPEMERGEFLATVCGALAYMFDWLACDAEGEELNRICTAIRALDALTRTDLRPRVGNSDEPPGTLH